MSHKRLETFTAIVAALATVIVAVAISVAAGAGIALLVVSISGCGPDATASATLPDCTIDNEGQEEDVDGTKFKCVCKAEDPWPIVAGCGGGGDDCPDQGEINCKWVEVL